MLVTKINHLFKQELVWATDNGQRHVMKQCNERCLVEFSKVASNNANKLKDLVLLLQRCLTSMEESHQ